MKMFQQPSKFLKFVAAIVLALPNSLALLAEPLHGCCRLAWTPTPSGPGPIPLEPFQISQINNSRDFIDELRANRTKTYQNRQPIVEFTQNQMARILDVYRGFRENRPHYQDFLWEEAANTSTNTATPSPGRKRRSPDVPGDRICPAKNIMQTLITAFNADDEPLQIVEFYGFEQWILRQECLTPVSQGGTFSRNGYNFNIACHTIQRSAYLVAIRLDGDLSLADIDLQEVQVESCSSFVNSE